MSADQSNAGGSLAPSLGVSINANLEVFAHYREAKYSSIKQDSYFQVYEQLFRKYVGHRITFVEVGVLNGGSLFMWRKYFGPGARIIGVEINPIAKRWEQDGFEIFIGSQSDPQFWDDFFAKVGPVDVLLDDGGHTNTQQAVTVHKAIPHIRDGGLLVVEDVCTSYLAEFGNPSRYSFVNFAKRIVDAVNSRSPLVKPVGDDYRNRVFSVSFFESMVAFNIDSRRCFVSQPTSNDGINVHAEDLKYAKSTHAVIVTLQDRLAALARVPILWRVAKVLRLAHSVLAKWESRKLRPLFRRTST